MIEMQTETSQSSQAVERTIAANQNAEPIYLVTGAGGFVGENLVRHLVKQGKRVRAMVRKREQASALKELVDEVVLADLQDSDSLKSAVDGVAGIYHIGALFRQEGSDHSVFHDINAEGTRRLLDAAVAAGVPRFIHCSTSGVHSGQEDYPLDENGPLSPDDHYQVSKLEGERIALSYFESGKIDGVVIRPVMIYGPGDARTLKLFKMIAKGIFFYVGDGNKSVHWIDVRDLAVAFEKAMNATHVSGEVCLAAGEKPMPLKDMVRVVAKALDVKEPRIHIPTPLMLGLADACETVCKPFGVEPPLYRRRVAFYLKNRSFDGSKARELLGYEPSQSFEDEIADIIAEYRRQGKL